MPAPKSPAVVSKAQQRAWRAEVPVEMRLAVSVEEAAGIVGVSRTILFGALRRGELPRLKIGGRTLIRRADLAAWLDRQVQTATAQ